MKNVEFGGDVQLRAPDSITQLGAAARLMDENPILADEIIGRADSGLARRDWGSISDS